MLIGDGLVGLAGLALLVYCVIEVITTPEDRVRNLPKLLWLVLVLFVPLIGAIAWLVAGRPQSPPRSLPYKGNVGAPLATGRSRPAATSPDDDQEFLESLRRRAEDQRRRAREADEHQDPPA
ncbi:MAG: hypothetical protein JWN17_1495 [Frankiales bacterium]|nr:hypothetical protein [Frankiales bacterium]